MRTSSQFKAAPTSPDRPVPGVEECVPQKATAEWKCPLKGQFLPRAHFLVSGLISCVAVPKRKERCVWVTS